MRKTFGNAKWIACDKTMSAPLIVKTFCAEKAQTATISIFGLGYYELFFNGKRISEEFFKPALSDYAKRDFSLFSYPSQDTTFQRVYYNTFRLSVQAGENTVAVLLGNGFFRQTKRTDEGDTSFGDRLILSFSLALKEGRVVTDGTEKCVESFIIDNNVFHGETQDYRFWNEKFLVGGGLEKATAVSVVQPTGVLTKQKCPNEKVVRRLQPQLVLRKGNKAIYDVGENIVGFVKLRPSSTRVTVKHAERLDGDGLDYASTGGMKQIQQVEYRNAVGRVVHPYFHWSGFRYFEIKGEIEGVPEVLVVHTPAPQTMEFRCENEILNWLFDAYVRTQTGALHGGITMDCPHRERLGYTGDGQLVAESAMVFLDCKSIFAKWIQDIADCQDRKSGHVQHTAPFMGGGGGPGGWGAAMVFVPYAYYKVYGDKEILRKYLKNMQAYLACMDGFCEDGLVVKERDGGWCLGDWCTPDDVKIPESLVNTFYYVRCMQIVQEIAAILGENADYSKSIDACKEALQAAYYDEATGEFCGNVQGANVFALLLDLGDERTKQKTIDKYRRLQSFDTGIMGTDLLAEYLVKVGEIQLLFDLWTGERFPSFGYMKNNGATTLWEGWRNEGSLNHPMLGGCVKQIVYGILGIRGDAGFQNITIAPPYIEGIHFLSAKLQLGGSRLELEYEYSDGTVHKKIIINGRQINE